MKVQGPQISLRCDSLPTEVNGREDWKTPQREPSEIQRRIISFVSKGTHCLGDLMIHLGESTHPKSEPISRHEVLRELYDLEQKGIIDIRFPCNDEALDTIHQGIHRANELCRESPGLWNVVAYEREWDEYQDFFDFLDTGSPNYFLKRFQLRIYMSQIEDYLDRELPRGAKILDAGGGIGRFSDECAKRGCEIFLVDSSERALKCALKHFEETGFNNYHLMLGDAGHLPEFPDDYFQAVFAMELICYCTDPEKVLKELYRITEPGGWLFISVEGKYGSMLADPKIHADYFHTVMDEGVILRKQDLYVCYYSEDEFRNLLEAGGLNVVQMSGTHYVPDGIFHRFVNEKGLGSKEGEAELWAIEKRCSEDPVFRSLARAWLAVCQKK